MLKTKYFELSFLSTCTSLTSMFDLYLIGTGLDRLLESIRKPTAFLVKFLKKGFPIWYKRQVQQGGYLFSGTYNRFQKEVKDCLNTHRKQNSISEQGWGWEYHSLLNYFEIGDDLIVMISIPMALFFKHCFYGQLKKDHAINGRCQNQADLHLSEQISEWTCYHSLATPVCVQVMVHENQVSRLYIAQTQEELIC